MYSIDRKQTNPYGGEKTVQPKGQRVAVSCLRSNGVKVTFQELEAAEPLIGYIRKIHEFGGPPGMAYRYNGLLIIESSEYMPRRLACLHSPTLHDWNGDGQIFEGWVLERGDDDKLHQVVQLWWVRTLEGLPVKPPIVSGVR